MFIAVEFAKCSPKAGRHGHIFSDAEDAEIMRAMEDALPALRAFARGLCCDRMVADDLVLAACERVVERVEQVTELTGSKSWLNRIVYTQWQDLLRKRQRRHNKILQFSLHWTTSGTNGNHPGDSERERVSRLDVEKALLLLSPDLRASVVLVGLLGYSPVAAGGWKQHELQ